MLLFHTAPAHAERAASLAQCLGQGHVYVARRLLHARFLLCQQLPF